MWAIKTSTGKLLQETLSGTKKGAYWALWNPSEESWKAYMKYGHKVVKVKLVEVKST